MPRPLTPTASWRRKGIEAIFVNAVDYAVPGPCISSYKLAQVPHGSVRKGSKETTSKSNTNRRAPPRISDATVLGRTSADDHKHRDFIARTVWKGRDRGSMCA